MVQIHIYTSCLFREVALAEIDGGHIRCLSDKIFQFDNKWCMKWPDYREYIDKYIEL